MPREVEYEPVSVKELLAEMKDTAELLIDLSYSAVLLRSDAVAEEVGEQKQREDPGRGGTPILFDVSLASQVWQIDSGRVSKPTSSSL